MCDPIDGSPPGFPIPGILQARYWSGLPFPSPMRESEVTQLCPTLSDPISRAKRPTYNIKTLCDKCTPQSNRKRLTYAMANSDIHSTFFLGATAHLTNKAIIKITWKNDEPIWTEQWPLMKDKLQATKEPIDTQLELKHIKESYSL